MKRINALIVAFVMALAGLVLWPVTLEAQCGTAGPTCMVRTTLNGNVDNSQTVITVTSGTGFTAGNQIWIDYEQMDIVAVSTTRITVRRGRNGTQAQAHDDADGIWTGDPAHFHTNDPDVGQDCTRGAGQAAYSPWINVHTGWIWICDNGVTAEWTGTVTSARTVGSLPTTF